MTNKDPTLWIHDPQRFLISDLKRANIASGNNE